jgi:hypothetical protein
MAGGRPEGCRVARSLEPPAPLATAACARAAGADLRLPPQHRLGTSADRGCDRVRAFDGLEGAASARSVTTRGCGQGAGQQLRVGLSRRSAAHGCQPICPLPAPRTPRHRRPLAALSQLDAPRNEGRLRLRARDRRRPLQARIRRTPQRREGSHGHRLRRARARLLRRAPDRGKAVDDRQRLHLHPQPIAARPARQPRHPPPQDQALPAPHQREGGALPPDDGARMGVRAQLPLTSTPQRRPATLAPQLQPPATAQLNRRPAPNQPRSQRPWGRTPSYSGARPTGVVGMRCAKNRATRSSPARIASAARSPSIRASP